MHNREEDIEILKKKKVQLAKAFVDAVTKQSVEKSKKLIVPFEIYKKLVDDKEMTAEKYDEALTLQCQNFFKKNKDFFDEHKKRLLKDELASSTIYDLGDKHEIEDGLYFSTIDALSISMSENVLEDGTVSTLGFQIDNPVVINNEIYINNFLSIKVYESLDNSAKIKKQHEAMGFKELSKNKFLEIMKDESYGDENYVSDYIWYVYNGDLTLSAEEFTNLGGSIGKVITGDLIVDGVLDVDSDSLFVLGDIKAKNIFVNNSHMYVGGTTYFDEAFLLSAGCGEPIVINDTKGTFVFNQLDSAEVNASEDKVKFLIDYASGKSFGNVMDFLIDTVLEKDYDGELEIDLDAMCRVILNNETIFKK